MDEKDRIINTLKSDYERLYTYVLMLRGLFYAVHTSIDDELSDRAQTCTAAYADLLEMVYEDVENSYAMCMEDIA